MCRLTQRLVGGGGGVAFPIVMHNIERVPIVLIGIYNFVLMFIVQLMHTTYTLCYFQALAILMLGSKFCTLIFYFMCLKCNNTLYFYFCVTIAKIPSF